MITFLQFCSLLMAFRSQPQMVSITTRRATDDDPPPGFQRLQTPTYIPFIHAEGFHQLLMATQDEAFGALVVRR
jgi:hypothetical protein